MTTETEDDDDRRQIAKQYWPITLCVHGRTSNKYLDQLSLANPRDAALHHGKRKNVKTVTWP